MKIRNGFVSNSSSSSFILIIPENKYEDWYNSLSTISKEVIDNIGDKITREVLGQQVVMISKAMGHDEYMFENVNIDFTDIYNLWDKIISNTPSGTSYINI